MICFLTKENLNILILMCCIIYYIYLKCRVKWQAHITERRKKEEEAKYIQEAVYNARQLSEYVRKKERTYWCNY